MPPNGALEVGPEAPIDEEAAEMDFDISSAEDEDNGDNKILETQDDSLSLPNLNIIEAEVDEHQHQSSPSADEV